MNKEIHRHFFFLEKQTIYLSGRRNLFYHETASIVAFIDPKISSASTVIWKKRDKEGTFQNIRINDRKYAGSTAELPLSMLLVRFDCEEDNGTYQICVRKFNKVIEQRFELKGNHYWTKSFTK